MYAKRTHKLACFLTTMVFGGPMIGLLNGCGSEEEQLPPPLCAIDKQENLFDEGEFHAPVGTALTFGTNPPNSGTHYPLWGRWGKHDKVVERGYYVHNLEHGGVALLYKCDTADGCPAIVSALEEIMNSQPIDNLCFGTIRNRMLLTADPLLDVPVAAAAWRNIYRAPCVDAPSLKAFIKAHYGKGPETTCSDGTVP